jgi:hypothetical protein
VRLERCTVDAQAQGLAVEQAPGRGVDLAISDSRLNVRDVTGAAVVVWAAVPLPASPGAVVLRRCRVEAGRALACRALGGKLRVEAERCRFVFHQALLSLDVCPAQHRWTSRLLWRDSGNDYQASAAWVRLDGRPTVWDRAGWRRLWSTAP